MTEKTEASTAGHPDRPSRVARDLPIHSLNMKHLIELDACTRCGECLNWCPVYDQDRRESLIPRRKVIDFLKIARAQQGYLTKIMRNRRISPSLRGLLGRVFRYRAIGEAEIDDFVKNLYECSTCGQCEVVCPAHIDTVGIWEELRRLIVQSGYGPLETQQALVKSVKAFDNPWQQPRAARTKWARRAKKDGLIQELPRDIRKTGGKVLLFFGCTASYDVNVKQVAVNTINILEALGIDYGVLGSEEKCCGSVLLRMGDEEHRRLFKENIDLFNSLGIETLISSCSGCFKTILQDYPRIAPLNFEVLHTVEFLTRLLKSGKLTFLHPVKRTVTYHDPCHLGRATGGFEAPRTIMKAIPGLKFVEMPRNSEYSRCCGAGGGLKAGFADIQNKMSQRRIKEAEATGAQELVSCCPFCFQGLNIGIGALQSQLVMRDLSSLVAESLLGYDVFEKADARPAEAPSESVTAAVQAPADAREARQLEREQRRAERRAARSPAAQPAADVAAAGGAESAPEAGDAVDPREAKKLARMQRRAERRAGGNASVPPQAATSLPQVTAETADAGGEALAEVADAREAKRLERERRRAERRAPRQAAPESSPGAEQMPAPQAPTQPAAMPAGEATVAEDAAAAPDGIPATAGGIDPAAEREARRAAKRAEREKEKAARRAAKENG